MRHHHLRPAPHPQPYTWQARTPSLAWDTPSTPCAPGPWRRLSAATGGNLQYRGLEAAHPWRYWNAEQAHWIEDNRHLPFGWMLATSCPTAPLTPRPATRALLLVWVRRGIPGRSVAGAKHTAQYRVTVSRFARWRQRTPPRQPCVGWRPARPLHPWAVRLSRMFQQRRPFAPCPQRAAMASLRCSNLANPGQQPARGLAAGILQAGISIGRKGHASSRPSRLMCATRPAARQPP